MSIDSHHCVTSSSPIAIKCTKGIEATGSLSLKLQGGRRDTRRGVRKASVLSLGTETSTLGQYLAVTTTVWSFSAASGTLGVQISSTGYLPLRSGWVHHDSGHILWTTSLRPAPYSLRTPRRTRGWKRLSRHRSARENQPRE